MELFLKFHGIPWNLIDFIFKKIIFLNIVFGIWLMIRCYLAKISKKRYILHWFQYRNSYFEHPSVSENGTMSAKMVCCYIIYISQLISSPLDSEDMLWPIVRIYWIQIIYHMISFVFCRFGTFVVSGDRSSWGLGCHRCYKCFTMTFSAGRILGLHQPMRGGVTW